MQWVELSRRELVELLRGVREWLTSPAPMPSCLLPWGNTVIRDPFESWSEPALDMICTLSLASQLPGP